MSDIRNWLLCFEYLPKGSLGKYITDASGGLEWTERLRTIKGICEGLHYLHLNRILHLDLKPANILLDDHMVPKIADFGLSRCLDENSAHVTTTIHMFGTPGYMAPEILYGGKITFASDIYSLGSIIMEILTGVKGYPEDENVNESWKNRLEGGNQLEQVSVCTKIGIECMEFNPEKRPDAQGIIDMLDKMASADKTATGSSLVGLQISLFNKQSLAESLKLQEDVNEHPETNDVAERLGNEGEENADHWSSQEEQVDRKGTSISSSNSTLLDKLNILNVFRSDAKRNFAINGGRVLKNVTGLKIFTKKEIKNITRNYAEFLGRGGYSRVYRGTLPDNTTVAVKILLMRVDEDRMEEFIKGVEVRTQMFHKNIVKLIGYCLEADVLISVNEYAANGSLMGILHGNKNRMLPLDLRLDIAIGSAEGLRHMHSVDIRHGNVKPYNILLDEKFTPKVSCFQLSQSLEVDEYSTKEDIGRVVYIDPVFKKTGMLTPKSDVYSFGVVLLELITRKTVYNCSLIIEYRKCYEIEKSGRAMFDKKIAAEEDIYVLEEIGKLAIECLNVDIEERPDMTEVTERLVMLRRDRRLVKARKS